MKTSNYKKTTDYQNTISIAGRCPKTYTGIEYKKLAPKYNFFAKYLEDGDKEAYTKSYYDEVLAPLDPYEIYNELCGLVEDEPILLCWEHEKLFCHRHLVADWLMEHLAIEIEEI